MVQTQIEGGDRRISELPNATSLAAADLMVIVQSGQTKNLSILQLQQLIMSLGPVTIVGGTLNNVTIGNITPGPGTFTTMSTPSATITGGTINGTTIGGTTPAVGTFSTMNAAALGGAAFATGIVTFLGTPSSANLAAAVTDETGTGALVFANTPSLVTPNLGTPASGVLTNTTAYPIARDIHAATNKATLATADEFGIWDSVSGTLQKSTWGSMLSQLQVGFTYADATGTSDAITATYTIPGFVSLTDGFDVTLGITAPNTTNAPTFTPTINGVAQTTHTIFKFVNNVAVPVAPGDLQGDVWLIYDLPNTRWILNTPRLDYIGNIYYSDAGGTSDAITATYNVSNGTLRDGYDLSVGITTPNTTGTPTFTPTLNGVAQTTRTIVRYVGGAATTLLPGDLQGHVYLKYDAVNLVWILINPANPAVQQVQSVSASVATNALTVGLNPTSLTFRNATLTTGTVTQVNISTALSLTVPSGATLGTTNAVQAQLVLLVAYNAGSPVLCIVNMVGGVNLDETSVISPTTISGTSNSNNVIYSASAVAANTPFRVVGYITITEATAGTWATAPTLVQGIGGVAGTAMQSFAFGQTYQNVGGSRVIGTTYYNTTARPILVIMYVTSTSAAAMSMNFTVNGIGLPPTTGTGASGVVLGGMAIVPAGASYSISIGGGSYSGGAWYELR